MPKLSEFEERFYTNFSVKFVELYLNFSKQEAALYAVETIIPEKMDLAKPFVDNEFEKRGYAV